MQFQLKNSDVYYTIRHSVKTKNARITLKGNQFEVVIPKGLKEDYAHELAENKRSWMLNQSALFKKEQKNLNLTIPLPQDKKEVLELKYHLKKEIFAIITKHNKNLGRPNQLKLKKMSSRWGSLSSQKNMNINWILAFAPKDVLEYVVVHEMCHLTHMNHSKSFWKLVADNCPHFHHAEKWLKQNGNALLSLPIP